MIRLITCSGKLLQAEAAAAVSMKRGDLSLYISMMVCKRFLSDGGRNISI